MAKLGFSLIILLLTVNSVSAAVSLGNDELNTSKAAAPMSGIKLTVKKISTLSDFFIPNLLLISQSYKSLLSVNHVSFSGDNNIPGEENKDAGFNMNNYSTQNYDANSNTLNITNYIFVYQTNITSQVQNKYYTVQIGAYKKFDNAMKYYNLLKKRHYPVYMQYADIHHKSIIYLRVGKYLRYRDASALRNKLRKTGFTHAEIKS